MKLFLVEQSKNFNGHLKHLKSKPIADCKSGRLREKKSEVLIRKSFQQELAIAFLTSYRIFPKSILRSYCYWNIRNREIQPGDTIVQEVFLPPFPLFSVKAIMGVLVTEVIEEADKVGFTYETLTGHAEKGRSTFTIEKCDEGMLFRIHTFSRPALPLIGLITRPYQAWCTRRALRNTAKQLGRSSFTVTSRQSTSGSNRFSSANSRSTAKAV